MRAGDNRGHIRWSGSIRGGPLLPIKGRPAYGEKWLPEEAAKSFSSEVFFCFLFFAWLTSRPCSHTTALSSTNAGQLPQSWRPGRLAYLTHSRRPIGRSRTDTRSANETPPVLTAFDEPQLQPKADWWQFCSVAVEKGADARQAVDGGSAEWKPAGDYPEQ